MLKLIYAERQEWHASIEFLELKMTTSRIGLIRLIRLAAILLTSKINHFMVSTLTLISIDTGPVPYRK